MSGTENLNKQKLGTAKLLNEEIKKLEKASTG